MKNRTLGTDAAFSDAMDQFGNHTLGSGLTKREYFAAVALQGLLAKGITFNATDTVETAVKCADSLIEKLNK